MSTQNRRQNLKQAILNPKEEFLNALRPLKKITWINHFIKTVEKPRTNMPTGKNANTEKLILALSIGLCLFKKNYSSLMNDGKSLKDYTNKYAMQVPVIQAPLVIHKLNEFIVKSYKK